MARLVLTSSSGRILNGLLVYSATDYSFGFDVDSRFGRDTRLGGRGEAYLAIGTLLVVVDVESGAARCVMGLHPHTRWQAGLVSPESSREGTVRVVGSQEFVAGAGYCVAEVGEWATTYDHDSGWVRVSPDVVDDDERVVIATGTVLGLKADHLNSVWLHPVFQSGPLSLNGLVAWRG